MAREKSHSRRNAVLAIVVCVLLLAGAVYVGWSVFGKHNADGGGQASVQDYPGPGAYPPVSVQINPGDTGAAMAKSLQQAGVVATVQSFVDAFAANPDASKIQPGTYNLLKEQKASDAVLALLSPANRVSWKVTIPEGYTVSQIVQRINEVTLIPVDDLNAALKDPTAIGLPAEAGGNAEGWLFPATYQVEPGATAASVFKQMTDQMVKVLTQKGVSQDQWKDVLTEASMVEREAGRDEDRPMMARAIENRLSKNMFLDVDATVSYGLGKTSAPTGAETDDASNPYNTYKHTGLPPTPIASPGASSIDAVLNPADGSWLFWVCVNFDTKETKFATTLDEQNQNVAEMKAWLAANATPSATP
ncbi:MAG TPA: endolytic transglycosylase MltG [Cellulomonas sp.]